MFINKLKEVFTPSKTVAIVLSIIALIAIVKELVKLTEADDVIEDDTFREFEDEDEEDE